MRRAQAGSDESVQETASDAVAGKCSAASLGYFEDRFLAILNQDQQLLGTPVRKLPPIINRGNFARVSCMEKLVLDFLSPPACSETTTQQQQQQQQEASKKRQVVSLGAGKDTLFFRLKDSGRAPRGGYFEVDFEAVTAWKARLIAKTPALSSLAAAGDNAVDAGKPPPVPLHTREEDTTTASGECPGGADRSSSPGLYRLVAADLRDTAGLEEGLRKAGVDFSAPTMFLAECVLVYMEPSASRALLQWCASMFPKSMFAAYEMTNPDDAFGKMMKQNIQGMGCLLPGLDAYPSLDAQEERFSKAGWDVSRAVDMLSVFEGFLDPEDVRRASKIEFLDEVEEWELIMRHYCLVVAAKGGDAASRLSSMTLDR